MEIRLFGPFRVLVDGKPIPRLRTRSIEWLLALLVLRHGRAVDRSWLAGTLWPESDESQALQNLRHDLAILRKALGPEAVRIQSPTRDTLLLDLTGADVDVVRFDSAIGAEDAGAKRAAVELYTGTLLEGCYAEWAVAERHSRETLYLAALEKLADRAEQRGEHADAVQLLRRAESMDPLRDSVVRRLMKALTESGDSLAAVAIYRTFRLRVRDQLITEPEADTTRLYNEIRGAAGVVRPGGPRMEVGTRQIVTRSALPHPITSLIGREHYVREICQRIQESRLVTLIGGGGVGKTRLAIEAASRAEAEFREGVIWVELAPLSEDPLVLPTLAEALGVQQAGTIDAQSLMNRIAFHLSGNPLLLILDNCEHLLDTVAMLAQSLLARCAGLRLLATSRQRLGITGEVILRVPSLPVADPDNLPSDAHAASIAAMASPAVELFVERASAVSSGFQLARREDVDDVCAICRRLDGIPLAIELAAARVRSLTVSEIHKKLDERFSLLKGSSAVLPRHQTLRSLIDWSYDLLNEGERALLCRLSVFVGGWTLAAAEHVCAGGAVNESDVLEILTSLADKSLVIAETSGATTRYRMLETMRQYAHDRLTAAGEDLSWRHRHLDFFLAMAVKAQPHLLDGADQKDWLGRLEPEHDNLRAAMEWGMESEGTIEKSLRMGESLWRFWMMRDHSLEGRARLLRVLAAAPASASQVRASVLTGAGNLSWILVDLPAAKSLHEQALAVFRELDNQIGIAAALNNLGVVANAQSDHIASKAFHEEALAMRRRSGDRNMLAYSLANLGLVMFELGDYEPARTLQEESLLIRRELDDRRGIAMCLANLAMVALEQGEPAAAHTYDEESLSIRWELGDMTGTALSFEGLAPASAALGDQLRAARLWGAAESLREQIHSPLTPNDLIRYGSQVAAARDAFGDDQAFEAAWQEGRMLPPEEAVELALTAD